MPAKSTGPSPCDVLFVGEAFGKEEAIFGQPFIGLSGKELRRMGEQAEFPMGKKGPLYPDQGVRLTNVFMLQPKGKFPDNSPDNLCGKRADVPKTYSLPALAQGKWVMVEFLHHLENLRAEIEQCSPRLIIALGNTATWALLQRTGISKLRGSIFPNALIPGGPPVFPTYHPANILREWGNRTIAVADLKKAKRWLDEGFAPQRRELWLEPTIEEVEEFCHQFILGSPRPKLLSFDIETFGETITCIGLSPTPLRSITIPFFDPGKPDRNYWPDKGTELRAWHMVHTVLSSDIPKLGQNGLYDIQYLYRAGIQVRNYLEDTMIRHHSLYPELEKGLGFLGSIYTDEAPWKLLRNRERDNLKLDDE